MVIFNNNGMLRGVFFFYASSCVFQSWPLIPTILVIVQGFFGMSPKYPVGSLLLLMRDKKPVLTGKAVLDTGKIRTGRRCQTKAHPGYLWSHPASWVPFCGFRQEVIRTQTWLWLIAIRCGNYITVENSWNLAEMRSSCVRAKDVGDAEWNNDCIGMCWSCKDNPGCSTEAMGSRQCWGGMMDSASTPPEQNWNGRAPLSFSKRKTNAFPWRMRLCEPFVEGVMWQPLVRIKRAFTSMYFFPVYVHLNCC